MSQNSCFNCQLNQKQKREQFVKVAQRIGLLFQIIPQAHLDSSLHLHQNEQITTIQRKQALQNPKVSFHLIIITQLNLNKNYMKNNSMEICTSPQATSTVEVIHKHNVEFRSNIKVDQQNGTSQVSRGEPLIQNYFSDIIDNQLIKITKIFDQTETITITDTISVGPDIQDFQLNREVSFHSNPVQDQSSQQAHLKLLLPPMVKAMLKKFKRWIREHRPQLIEIYQKTKESSRNQKDFKQKMSKVKDLREMFVMFAKEALSSEPSQKGLVSAVKRWIKVLKPIEEKYMKSEDFLNDMLTINQ